MSQKRLYAYLLLLLVSVIWGAASPIVKYTLQWFHPVLFLTYRFAISSVVALILFRLYPVRIPKKPADRWLAFATAMLSTPISIGLFFLALTKTSALSGSLITAGSPILLVAAGAIFLRERVTPAERVGIAVTVIGTLVATVGPLVFNHTANHVGTFEGNTIMVLATLADLTATLLTKIGLRRGISLHLFAHAQFILGFLLFLLMLLFLYPVRQSIVTVINAPWQAHAAVLFMSLVSGTFAYTIRNVAVNWIEVSEAAIFSYLQPVWAAILAVVWLGETVTPAYLYGGSIIALGVILSEYRRSQKKRAHRHLAPAYRRALRPAGRSRNAPKRR